MRIKQINSTSNVKLKLQKEILEVIEAMVKQ